MAERHGRDAIVEGRDGEIGGGDGREVCLLGRRLAAPIVRRRDIGDAGVTSA